MFSNNPEWYFIPASKYIEYGFWAKAGGRTQEEVLKNAEKMREKYGNS